MDNPIPTPAAVTPVTGSTPSSTDIILTDGFFVENSRQLVELLEHNRQSNTFHLRERLFGTVTVVSEIKPDVQGKTDAELVRSMLGNDAADVKIFNGITYCTDDQKTFMACNGYMLQVIGKATCLIIYLKPTGRVASGCAADPNPRDTAVQNNQSKDSDMGPIKKFLRKLFG